MKQLGYWSAPWMSDSSKVRPHPHPIHTNTHILSGWPVSQTPKADTYKKTTSLSCSKAVHSLCVLCVSLCDCSHSVCMYISAAASYMQPHCRLFFFSSWIQFKILDSFFFFSPLFLRCSLCYFKSMIKLLSVLFIHFFKSSGPFILIYLSALTKKVELLTLFSGSFHRDSCNCHISLSPRRSLCLSSVEKHPSLSPLCLYLSPSISLLSLSLSPPAGRPLAWSRQLQLSVCLLCHSSIRL